MVPLMEKAHYFGGHCFGGHCFAWHGFDRHTLGRVNIAVMLGLLGSGLVACALGAFVYDISRLIAVW